MGYKMNLHLMSFELLQSTIWTFFKVMLRYNMSVIPNEVGMVHQFNVLNPSHILVASVLWSPLFQWM